MNQHPPEGYVEYDDEIDLTDYIRALIKRKWFIIIGTLLCFIGGVVYSSTKKVPYEARASLLVIPSAYKTELAPPTFTMNVYEALATAQDLMQAVIDSLELRDSEGQKLSIPAVDGLLNTEIVEADNRAPQSGAGSSLMHLIVTSVDTMLLPPVAIANVWAELFVRRNSGINSQETGGSYDFILEQYEVTRKNLQAAEDSLVKLNQRNQVDILKADLAPTSSKLVEYQANMVNTGLELSTLEETLRAQEQQLLALETPEGQWVGSLDIEGYDGINPLLLDEDQRRILETTVRNRDDMRMFRKRVRNFEDERDLVLMAEDLKLKRSTLVDYMNELSRMEVDMSSVSQALEEIKNNGEGGFSGGAIVETLPPEILREFASLRRIFSRASPA